MRRGVEPAIRMRAACQQGLALLVMSAPVLLLAQAPQGAQEAKRPPPLPHPDLPAAPAVPEAIPWVLLISAGLAIAALVGLVVWLLFFLPRLPTPPPLRRAKTVALEALRKLRAGAEGIPPAEMSSRVSTIVRQYLADRYGVPAPRRTTHEIFNVSSKAVEALHPGFNLLAQWCDGLSFMPQPVTAEQSVKLIDAAIQRLEDER